MTFSREFTRHGGHFLILSLHLTDTATGTGAGGAMPFGSLLASVITPPVMLEKPTAQPTTTHAAAADAQRLGQLFTSLAGELFVVKLGHAYNITYLG